MLVEISLLIDSFNMSKWAIGTFVVCFIELSCHSISCCANETCSCDHICEDNRRYRGFLRIIIIAAMIYTFVILSMYYLEKRTFGRVEVIINIIYFLVCVHTYMLNYFIYIIYIPFWKYILAPVCKVIRRGIWLCCPYILRCLSFVNNVCN
jgi:hypothetical protein